MAAALLRRAAAAAATTTARTRLGVAATARTFSTDVMDSSIDALSGLSPEQTQVRHANTRRAQPGVSAHSRRHTLAPRAARATSPAARHRAPVRQDRAGAARG